jgi:protein-S-isoprenylcysteine O-methyltransferase Ste14
MTSRLPALGPRGEGWLLLQLLLMGAIVGSTFIFEPFLQGGPAAVVAALGVALIGLGVGLVALGARQLGRAATPLPRPLPDTPMVTHGLYGHVRHPIYAGVVLSALGWALVRASLPALVLVGVLAVLLDLKARREEAWLRQHHAGYAEYLRGTSRFIPRLY